MKLLEVVGVALCLAVLGQSASSTSLPGVALEVFDNVNCSGVPLPSQLYGDATGFFFLNFCYYSSVSTVLAGTESQTYEYDEMTNELKETSYSNPDCTGNQSVARIPVDECGESRKFTLSDYLLNDTVGITIWRAPSIVGLAPGVCFPEVTGETPGPPFVRSSHLLKDGSCFFNGLLGSRSFSLTSPGSASITEFTTTDCSGSGSPIPSNGCSEAGGITVFFGNNGNFIMATTSPSSSPTATPTSSPTSSPVKSPSSSPSKMPTSSSPDIINLCPLIVSLLIATNTYLFV